MPQLLKRRGVGFSLEFVFEAKSPEEYVREAKRMREDLTERQIDQTLEDTFPASDPPGWY